MCPNCGRSAPIVYRGVVPYCTACGHVRAPLANRSVNLAGKPLKVGGVVTSAVGWVVLTAGVTVALALFLILYALGAVTIGLALALPVLTVTVVMGVMLVAGGKSMGKSGAETQRATREEAVFALAAHRGGLLSALDVASALDLPPPDADALLTAMAKRDPDRIAVDLDDQGTVLFRFVHLVAPGIRVAEPAARPESVVDEEFQASDDSTSSRRRPPPASSP
jgi:hypothetical protein